MFSFFFPLCFFLSMCCLFSKNVFFFFFWKVYSRGNREKAFWMVLSSCHTSENNVEIYLPHITVLILFEPGYFGFVCTYININKLMDLPLESGVGLADINELTWCICLKQQKSFYPCKSLCNSIFRWSRTAGLVIYQFNLQGVLAQVSKVLKLSFEHMQSI